MKLRRQAGICRASSIRNYWRGLKRRSPYAAFLLVITVSLNPVFSTAGAQTQIGAIAVQIDPLASTVSPLAQKASELLTRLAGPDGSRGTVGFTMVLTDGTVMAQDAIDHGLWWRLTPDIFGSFSRGTWSRRAHMPASYAPDGFAAAVLADGRVLIVGGEYLDNQNSNYDLALSNRGAIYDPVADKWRMIAPPPGIEYIGDAPSVVLPNGKFLLGAKLSSQMAVFDPANEQWTLVEAKRKNDLNAEEGWTLLPDGSILTLDVKNGPETEIYMPDNMGEKNASSDDGIWEQVGRTPEDLHSNIDMFPTTYPGGTYLPVGEIGPAILRPDGTVFATGASNSPQNPGHTAIFDTRSRRWGRGPDFPQFDSKQAADDASDMSAVLLPSGNVLVAGRGVTTYVGVIPYTKYYLYEFDGTTLQPAAPSMNDFCISLSVLPTGEVLVATFDGSTQTPLYLFRSASSAGFKEDWAPVIRELSAPMENVDGGLRVTLRPETTYRIWGEQFNGLSQGQAVGDEGQAAQNYPLIRITNKATRHVFYARTHDHSTMAVATGSQRVSTNFEFSNEVESGASTIEVVANGIPSKPLEIDIR